MVTFKLPIQENYSRVGALLRLLFGVYLIIYIIHFIMAYVFSMLMYSASFLMNIMSLFTGKTSDSLYTLIVGGMRFTARVMAAASQLTDKFPPFHDNEDENFGLTLNWQKPESISGGLALCRILCGIIYIPLIPHFIVLYIYMIGASIANVIGVLAILFTGKFPAGLHSFIMNTYRYYFRVLGYAFGLTDQYPPFNGKE